MSTCSVRVIGRFRPLNENEKKKKGDSVRSEFDIKISEGKRVDIKLDKANHTFTYDAMYGDDSIQSEIYEVAAKPCIDDVLNGFNGTIFAYGQTGTGKTWSMFGVREDEDLRGIIPRAGSHIFSHIESDESSTEYAIKCSFLEIYKEKCHDLLNPSSGSKKEGLPVRESAQKGVWVDGLTEEFLSCEEDLYEMIAVGEASRTVSSTEMNNRSSRSHSVFVIIIEQKMEDGSTRSGRLNLVDLAGSERVSKTGASGAQLDEAKEINKSLSTLGRCIYALSEASAKGQKAHIPYRESQLTRILQESLGGNTKTTLLIMCSPALYNADETVSALRFGASAKAIKTVVSVNRKRSIEELENLAKNLQNELVAMKKYVTKLEGQILIMSAPDYDPKTAPPFDLKKLKASASTSNASSTASSEASGAPSSPGPLRSSTSSSSLLSPPSNKGRRLSMSTDDVTGDEGGEYDPFAAAELKLKLENSELQLKQLKVEVKDARQKEEDNTKMIKETLERCEQAEKKAQQIQTKNTKENAEFTKKLQDLTEELQRNKDESDESIIVLYEDNERLQLEIDELQNKLKGVLRQSAAAESSKKIDTGMEQLVTELEDTVSMLNKKLRLIEEGRSVDLRSLATQKERVATLTAQTNKLTSDNSTLEEQSKEMTQQNLTLQEQLNELKRKITESDKKHKEEMEALRTRKAKIFRPIRKKKDEADAYHEKVDIQSHMKSLKKTNSPFLQTAKQEHVRSQTTRGEALFGLKSAPSGQLTSSMREQYIKLFHSLDKDGSGSIEIEELRSCLTALGKKFSEEQLQKLFKEIDSDGSGSIDLEEFIRGMSQQFKK